MEQQNQEQPIAVAKFTPTEETYQNMIFLMNLRRNRAIQLGGAGLILLSGLQLYLKSSTRMHIALLCLLAGIGFLFVAIGKFYPGVQGKKAYKDLMEQFGGHEHLPVMVQSFYTDHVDVHSEKSTKIRTYKYADMTDIRENADMIVFVFSKNIGVAVPRKAFVEGKGYDVSKLIRNNYKFTASTSLYLPKDTREILQTPKM